MSCVFCQILANEAPASVVFESALVIAFLDIRPANVGHTLVVPRRHAESFTELTPAEVAEVALCGQRVAAALKRGAVPCDGITLSLGGARAAGAPRELHSKQLRCKSKMRLSHTMPANKQLQRTG